MNQMLIQMSMDTNWGNCVDKIWDPDIPSQYLHTISYQSAGQSQEICQLSKIIQNLVQFRDNPRCWVWGGRGSSRHLQLGSTESFKPASQCPEFDCGWVQSGVRCAGLTWRALTLCALLLVYLARTLGWGQTTMGVSIQSPDARM